MKKVFFWIVIVLVSFLVVQDAYQALAAGIAVIIFSEILLNSNQKFVFREWALLLYAINYLVAPAMTYHLSEAQVTYKMKLDSDQYFELALPGFFCFALGMFVFRTRVFEVDFSAVNATSLANEQFLKSVTLFGVLLNFVATQYGGDMSFFIYLFSLIRFVGAFALFALNSNKWFWVFVILSLELLRALLQGMYHDATMWIIFFGLFYAYVKKPSVGFKLIALSSFVVFLLFIQAMKDLYRSEVWFGNKGASIETVVDLGSQIANEESLGREDNLLFTLNRGNQAWIFASTVDNMNRNQNFQGMSNVNKYVEAAILPRFLAPDKIKSGDKEIFNKFSGHQLDGGTSMGLGIFADGYISYGTWGVYTFGFVLGLIFAITFKVVERWTKVSPLYALLLLPILNFAVRPDCELQTTINHLFKGILLYGFLVYLTRKRFTLDSQENQRKLSHLNFAKGNVSR